MSSQQLQQSRASLDDLPDFAKSSFARSLFAVAAAEEDINEQAAAAADASFVCPDNEASSHHQHDDDDKLQGYVMPSPSKEEGGEERKAFSRQRRHSRRKISGAPLRPSFDSAAARHRFSLRNVTAPSSNDRTDEDAYEAELELFASRKSSESDKPTQPVVGNEDSVPTPFHKESIDEMGQPFVMEPLHDNNDNNNYLKEQYRILAQHEARLRVVNALGYDFEEVAKQKALQRDEHEKQQRAMKQQQQQIRSMPRAKEGRALPLPKIVATSLLSNSGKLKARYSFTHNNNNNTVQQEPAIAPGFLIGQERNADRLSSIFQESTNNDLISSLIENQEHVVVCKDCQSGLRVKIWASLVKCPVCNSICPATSFVPHS